MLSSLLVFASADWQCWMCSQRDKKPVPDFGTVGVGTEPMRMEPAMRVEFTPGTLESHFSKYNARSGRTTPSTRASTTRTFRDGSRLSSTAPTPVFVTPRGIQLGGYNDRASWQPEGDDDIYSQADPMDDTYLNEMNDCREELRHALRREERQITSNDGRLGASGQDAFRREITRCVTKSLQGLEAPIDEVSDPWAREGTRQSSSQLRELPNSGSGSEDSDDASEGGLVDREYQRKRVEERIGAIRRRQHKTDAAPRDVDKKARAVGRYQDLMRNKFKRLGVDGAQEEEFEQTSNPIHAVVDAVARYHSHCAQLGEYYAIPGAHSSQRQGLSSHQHEELDTHARKLREPDPTRFMPGRTTRI